MLALRSLHEQAKKHPSFVEPDPRSSMKKLAARYPGALREIDRLEMKTIRRRIAEIARAEHDATRVTPWMIAQARFHSLARGVLAAKRWLAAPTSSLPRSAVSWKDDLDRVARPPRGRLMELVFARLADELGLDVDECRALVFGAKTID